MRDQIRNEPSAKEILRLILRKLRLRSDLRFWHLRQEMFHRGDIDRARGLEPVASEMCAARDLLGRMLLRMLGYGGKVWRSDTQAQYIAQLP